MTNVPYVIQKCAMSIDGYIDDTSHERLILSNAEDFDRVDEVRSTCDAILVGAGTIRADNPRLLVRSEDRRQRRALRGLTSSPMKATITRSGILDASADFFVTGNVPKLVYCIASVAEELASSLAGRAEVIPCGNDDVNPKAVLQDLARRGVRRLLVEGGSAIGTMFLSAGLVDELQVSIAPFFVGDEAAPRFVNPASFPHNKRRRMQLTNCEQVGDIATLVYQLRTEETSHIG